MPQPGLAAGMDVTGKDLTIQTEPGQVRGLGSRAVVNAAIAVLGVPGAALGVGGRSGTPGLRAPAGACTLTGLRLTRCTRAVAGASPEGSTDGGSQRRCGHRALA